MVNGLSGERMLIGLAIGIAVLIFLVLKTKIQAFLALIISTVVVGVIGGMPLTNITIEVEALDDEAYKTKFKAYASGSDMPDLVNAWGQPSFLNEIIDAGLLAELNMDDYADYGFISGSLDGFSKEGKLYGLARNTDVMGFYYNKALFESNGWTIPTTYDELLTLAGKIQEAGLIPVSMDGSDKWPISIYVHDLMQKIDPSIKTEVQSSIANADFSNPVYTQAADLMVQAVDAGMFQNGFETTDNNVFTLYILNETVTFDGDNITFESIDRTVYAPTEDDKIDFVLNFIMSCYTTCFLL